jgi:hypothetical protein
MLASEFYRQEDRLRSFEIVAGLPLLKPASATESAAA